MYGISSWAAELRCPIPARLCPHADAVQEWLVDWADRIIGPLGTAGRERLSHSGVARYAGRLYPDASEADLRVLAAIFTWFFLLDDACDGSRRPRTAEVTALCDGVLRLLRSTPPAAGPAPAAGVLPRTGQATAAPGAGRVSAASGPTRTGHPGAAPPRPGHHPGGAPAGTRSTNQPAARLTIPAQSRASNQPPASRPDAPRAEAPRADSSRPEACRADSSRPEAFDGPLRRMLAEAWRIPYQRMSAAWRDRFVDAVAHHLAGVVTEAANKASGRRPGVAEYIPLRRATSAAYVSYVLIEFATGRPVPDAIYHHPAVRQVADTANDLLSWFNDLLSLERDAATSGGHNLVLAVALEQRLPIEAAIEAVVRRWQQSMRRFVELRDAVPSFGPALDGPLRQYLDGLGNSVRGTMDWSMESARYRDALAATRPAEPLSPPEPLGPPEPLSTAEPLGPAEPPRRPGRPPTRTGATDR